MSEPRTSVPRSPRHGNIFSRDSGSMLIHVHRESGLAHRTLSLSPWQVQVVRAVATKWFAVLVIAGLASWVFFAVQAATIPLLTRRLVRMEVDARRLDTLQQALARLQQRYDQVQHMLSAPNPAAIAATTKAVDAGPRRRDSGAARPTASVRRDSTRHATTGKSKSDSGASKRLTKSDSGAKPRLP